MNIEDFINAINLLSTVKSVSGKTYSNISANKSYVSGIRVEAGGIFHIKTDELFNVYNNAPHATTTELKKFISGRVQSPSKAILDALNSKGQNKSETTVKKGRVAYSQLKQKGGGNRANSDEYYVIGLCNKVLNREALQQHRFDFLKGDSGAGLPVDAYYPDLNLVVEYRERQHTESVKFFDRKQTVSGVSRGEQRKIYDQRRRDVLPKHGIDLVEISYSDFGTTKKLVRNEPNDLVVVKEKLSKYL